ncbi:hypothetical protein QJ854_gp349 [Moumouvirus goulette]|uniref:Repeat protein n=1 Tax=Moumouvirus goulette TaxID=1247379 RepID=M1PH93_9VIRU|nr:hypothetical protein QJ854_gp349 [Moumouvirus goulette]AGF85433.1 hypothetical protein glt_00624 [Moumouvirus goulette]
MNKNIMDMSETDIKRYLSTKNISKNMKKQLENRLSVLSQNNLYNVLENMEENTQNVEIIYSNKKKRNRKTRVENNQTLLKKSEENRKEIIEETICPVLNYSNVVKNDESEIQIPVKNNFVDGKLIIPYTEIMNMYDYFAIYRIKMQHIILNKKIHILNSMQFINYSKGIDFKNKLGYDNICKQENNCRICINVCTDLEELLDCYKSCIDLLTLGRKIQRNTNNFMEVFKNTQEKYYNIVNIIFSFNDDLFKYKAIVANYITHLKYILDIIQIISHQDILLLSSKTSIIFFEIEKLIDEIINSFDVEIDCEYYVIISDKIENPITPIAIKNIELLECNNKINLNTNNINLDDYLLNNMSIEEFNQLFSKFERDNDDDFIRIYQNTKNGLKYININFYLEHEIISPKIQIEISGLPKNAYTLTSIIHNYDADNKYELPILPQNMNKYRWLENDNEENYLSVEEYESLDNYWKELFSYEQIYDNKYILNYIFYCLTKMDNNIIEDEMFDSFINLSKNTSYLSNV